MNVEERKYLFVALEAERRPLQRLAASLPVHQFGLGYENGLQAALSCEESQLFGNIGLSGGTVGPLTAGDVVVVRKIIGQNPQGEQVCYETDDALAGELAEKIKLSGLRIHEGSVACVSGPVLTSRVKAELGRQTGSLAVDMESAAVAKAAEELRKPFFCLRVICDPLHRSLHEALLVGVDDRGNSRPGRLALALLQRPSLLNSFLAMLRDYNQAAKTLARLGPCLEAVLRE
jgi:hypothetical protein